jgi:hypothetical protein
VKKGTRRNAEIDMMSCGSGAVWGEKSWPRKQHSSEALKDREGFPSEMRGHTIRRPLEGELSTKLTSSFICCPCSMSILR